IVPAELCKVIPGQLYKKCLPSSVTSTVVDFATQRPQDRLRTITHGMIAGIQSPVSSFAPNIFATLHFTRFRDITLQSFYLMLEWKLG
ncbi:hypothetical protein B0H14DRAFT_2384618, partial [Mycena olivaceomarginata]